MDIKFSIVLADEKELFERLLKNPRLTELKTLFKSALGDPVWWIAAKSDNKKLARVVYHPSSSEIWHDGRLKSLSCKKQDISKIASKHKDHTPQVFQCKKHQLTNVSIQLSIQGKKLGFLCLSHSRLSNIKKNQLNLLKVTVDMILSDVLKSYELQRLSESIRPRAIALSTVHTVHRIITSTLNLNELVTRLANLTAQVLRSRRCAIFLNDPERTPRTLIERAKAGFPAKAAKSFRALKPGEGLEGRVFATAKNVRRKNVMCVPLIDEDVIGVICLSGKKEGKGFATFDQEILVTLAEEAVIAIKNAQLYEEQKRVTLSAIQSLAAILAARFDLPHKLPQDILLKITLSMTDVLRLSEEDKQAIHYATLLKDAGKISLPEEIMRKPTKLTGEEYKIIHQHPIKGAMIVQSFESLKPVAPIILYAHEHFDGQGYPHGLKADEIPIGSRILAIVNTFDALIGGRPYKTRATLKEALEEVKSNRGTQFDPVVVDAFNKVIRKPPIWKFLSRF